MILKASQRGHAAQLARHLLNARDNEHVAVHDLRGFVSDDLDGALREADAIAKGTRCTQFLFSLSLNPPETEQVPVEAFEAAIAQVEQKLGLDHHPRAIVFHEKEGRRHAHPVWSRIDVETMTAKNLPYFKNRLMEVSRELYLEHGWDMPKGMIDQALRNPLNFTRAEWQQAKRVHHDPRLIKAMFRECWQGSDDAAALGAALADKGYYLARGDRRGVVAVDWRGEVYALARWSGVKAKDVKARIPEAKALPSVEETRRSIAVRIEGKLKTHMQEVEAGYARLGPSIEFKREQLVQRHRNERRRMNDQQEQRWQLETKARAARLPRGMGAIWSRITGRFAKIRKRNEYEAFMAYRRDVAQKDALIARQLEERQKLQNAIRQLRDRKARDLAELRKEIADYLGMRRDDLPKIENFNEKARPKTRTRDRGRTRDDGPDFEQH